VVRYLPRNATRSCNRSSRVCMALVRLARPVLYVAVAVSAWRALRNAKGKVGEGNEALLEQERYSVWGGSE
jgi:hypothetical protein